eukprot:321186_1
MITTQVLMVAIICVSVVVLGALFSYAFCCCKHYHYKERRTQNQKYSSVPIDPRVETSETPQQPGADDVPPAYADDEAARSRIRRIFALHLDVNLFTFKRLSPT